MSYRGMEVLPRFHKELFGSLEENLRFYHCGMLNGLSPLPELVDELKLAVEKLPHTVSPEAAEIFLAILRRTAHLGTTLRSLYDVGILERLIPDMAHARCLLQFNQYHSYTVDEHTLWAVESGTEFEHVRGALGNAYRAIQRKEILHFALLLHDLGKGYEEDHREVGKGIAERTTVWLHADDLQARPVGDAGTFPRILIRSWTCSTSPTPTARKSTTATASATSATISSRQSRSSSSKAICSSNSPLFAGLANSA